MSCLKILFRITFMICCCFTPGIGSKQQPLHVLVVHGSLPVICPSPLTGSAMRRWFEEESEEVGDHNRVEGVVWHCPSGALYKVLWRHRSCRNQSWLSKYYTHYRGFCKNFSSVGISYLEICVWCSCTRVFIWYDLHGWQGVKNQLSTLKFKVQ